MAKTSDKSEDTSPAAETSNDPGYFERRVKATSDLLVEHGVLTEEEARAVKHGHTHGNVFEEFHTNNPIDTSEHELTPFEKQMLALSNILREKGIITTDEVRRKTYENEGAAWQQGSRVVARAWVDPAYKKRLFEDGIAAAEELGVDMSTANQLIAVENTPKMHHVVVCTLCSCYPRQLLGQPPDWYKSTNYRNRVVVDPRLVLAEMGLDIPESSEVTVVDSTAETRYLVVPERPAGTDDWAEEQLAGLVTRNSMVGVSKALTPEQKKSLAD